MLVTTSAPFINDSRAISAFKTKNWFREYNFRVCSLGDILGTKLYISQGSIMEADPVGIYTYIHVWFWNLKST